MRARRALAGAAFLLAAAGLTGLGVLDPGTVIRNESGQATKGPSLAERIRRAEERSANVRGVYMTSGVANDGGASATRLRKNIEALIDETELDAVVIDTKETTGGAVITDRVGELIQTLHAKDVWVIARHVVFKDDSQEHAHPEWYLHRPDGSIWRDRRGGSWLDPASPDVWAYQLSVAKDAADAGFDEVQFDYIRFPSDGDVARTVYPVYRPERPKHKVLAEFFDYLHSNLKAHRPDLILSADLFGYVALQRADLGIGQRLEDIGENFDYISLMVYPSHYYAGFQVAADLGRGLPALSYPYRAANPADVATSHPYEVVERSLLIAKDFLEGRATTSPTAAMATSTPPSTPTIPKPPPKIAKLRPWLQDFDLGADTARGIHYDAAKVRAQIDAAEAAGSAGWLLWNSANVYTTAALQPKPGPRENKD